MFEEILVFTVVFIVYMAVLIIVGVLSSRKVETVEDYYVAGRNVGPALLGFHYGTVYLSSVLIIGGGAFAYRYGMATLWIAFGNLLLGTFLPFLFLGGRIRVFTEKLGVLTLPEYFSARYESKFLHLWSALLTVVFMTVYVVSIFMGVAYLFQVIAGLSYEYSLILTVLIVGFYLTVGGTIACIWSGFIQGIVMIFGTIFLSALIIVSQGGFSAINHNLAAIPPPGGYVDSPGIWGFWGLFSFTMVSSLGPWGLPQSLTRFYTMKNRKVIKWAIVFASFFCFIMTYGSYFNGATARLIIPESSLPMNPSTGTVNYDFVMPNLITRMLTPVSPVLTAVFLTAVIAASQSTAGTVILMASFGVAKDIYHKMLRPEATERRILLISKICTVAITLVGLWLAYMKPKLILDLSMMAWAALASAIMAPFIYSLFWKNATRTAAIVTSVVSFALCVVWQIIYFVNGVRPFGIHEFLVSQALAWTIFPIVNYVSTRLHVGLVSEKLTEKLWLRETVQTAFRRKRL